MPHMFSKTPYEKQLDRTEKKPAEKPTGAAGVPTVKFNGKKISGVMFQSGSGWYAEVKYSNGTMQNFSRGSDRTLQAVLEGLDRTVQFGKPFMFDDGTEKKGFATTRAVTEAERQAMRDSAGIVAPHREDRGNDQWGHPITSNEELGLETSGQHPFPVISGVKPNPVRETPKLESVPELSNVEAYMLKVAVDFRQMRPDWYPSESNEGCLKMRAQQLGVPFPCRTAAEYAVLYDHCIAHPMYNGVSCELQRRKRGQPRLESEIASGVRYNNPQPFVGELTVEQMRKLPIAELKRISDIQRKRTNRTGLSQQELNRRANEGLAK